MLAIGIRAIQRLPDCGVGSVQVRWVAFRGAVRECADCGDVRLFHGP